MNMSWYRAVAVRTVRTYLQAVLGFVAASASGADEAMGIQLAAGDFADVLMTAASFAVAPAVITLIWNTIELLGKLDRPSMRA